MNYEVEFIDRELCYSGFYRLHRYRLRHELFAGGWSEAIYRELIEQRDGVGVIPYDPDLDQVVMIEQFRLGAARCGQGWVPELVAGLRETGEEPAEVVRRELREETGLDLLGLEYVSEFMLSPGGSTERLKLFCARVDAGRAGGVHGCAEEGEDIRVQVMGAQDALALPSRGQALSATTVVGLQWLAANRTRLRAQWS